MQTIIILGVLALLILLILVKNICVVQQSRAYVVERLGAFHSVWGVGMHFKVPFIERVCLKRYQPKLLFQRIIALIKQR